MDLSTWRSEVHKGLRNLARTLKQHESSTLYGFLSACTLLPVFAAINQGDYAAIVALSGVVGGVGGNLIANQIQAWKEHKAAELAPELAAKAQADPDWRQALDKLQQQFDAPVVVEASIRSETDKAWFKQTLAEEVKKLAGNTVTVNASSGIGVGGNVSGNAKLLAGNTVTYVEQQFIGNTSDPQTLRTRYLALITNQFQFLPLRGTDIKASDADAAAREQRGLADVYIALNTIEEVEKDEGRKRDDGRRTEDGG